MLEKFYYFHFVLMVGALLANMYLVPFYLICLCRVYPQLALTPLTTLLCWLHTAGTPRNSALSFLGDDGSRFVHREVMALYGRNADVA